MNLLVEINIFIHLIFGLICLILGAYLLVETKGNKKHKLYGKIYAFFLLIVVLTSLFIRELNNGAFSWIHWLSLFTFLSLVYALFMIKNKKIESHRYAMTGIYLGLIIAGILSVSMPGRFLTS